MIRFSFNITKTNFFKIIFIINITLIRAFVLLLPAYLIKIIIDNTLPSKNIMSLILISILVAVIPFFTNFLINIDLKLSSYMLNNSKILAGQIAYNSIFFGVNKHEKSKILHILSSEIPNVSKFYFRNIGSIIWILGTNLFGIVMILKSSISLGLVFIITILIGVILLSPFYKKYADTEKNLNNVKIIQNNQSTFIDQIKEKILINSNVKGKLITDLKKTNTKGTELQKKLVYQEQKILFTIDCLKKLIIFEIFFIGYFILNINNIGTLVATYEISIWLLPSITLLIQIILSLFSILPQINNISEVDNSNFEDLSYQTKINLSNNRININYGKLGKFSINKKFSLEYGKTYLLKGSVGAGKSTTLNILTKQLKKENINVWLSTSKPIIFNDTIMNNILLGKNISKGKLIEKLKNYGFSKNILLRLDDLVDENKISGGEAQLIEIARLMIDPTPPDFIIFDESFSALDNKTFDKIWENVSAVFKNKIIIIVSHNLPKKIKIDKNMFFSDYFIYEKN
ncbi:ATP-binding cassette domain-containing protein [Fructilactobacillus frigidiflavus]|uniref:ATP-binding cassette domain-containing protein n=1 Tax=Fructilactobacillus frigidiflavus TaxID=3242688 RepID=UPI0037570878